MEREERKSALARDEFKLDLVTLIAEKKNVKFAFEI